MFCSKCRTQVERNFKFCPECGFNFTALTQNLTQNVATSTTVHSVAAERHQQEDQNKVPKDITEEKEKTDRIKGELACFESKPATDGSTPQDPLESIVIPAKGETTHTGSSLHPPSSNDKEFVTPQATETFKEEDRKSNTASESKSQLCSEVAPGSVSMASPSTTHDEITVQQTEAPSAISTDDSTDVHLIPADKLSGVHPGLPLLTPTKETSSTGPDLSEQTHQQSDCVTQQPVSGENKDKKFHHETHNVSGRPYENEKDTNREQHTFTIQTDQNEDYPAGDQSCSSDDKNIRKVEYSADPCPVTKEKNESIEAVNTKSDENASTNLAVRQGQQPGTDVDVSKSPTPSSQSEKKAGQVTANILEESYAPPTLQTSSISGSYVYFHAVTSKDPCLDPEKDSVFLISKALFGSWTSAKPMTFSRPLSEKRYLVELRVMVPKSKIHECIPYKYVVRRYTGNKFEDTYEKIYQKEENCLINRCLTINLEALTREGEWHQYDDAIHLNHDRWTLKSTKSIVKTERDQAGMEMLKIIFDLLTTWNEQNVGNFFVLLEQFFSTYSNPVLHDGRERNWELNYGKNEVKNLLKTFLKENILRTSVQKGKPDSLLPPLHAGVVGLLVYNKYLRESIPKKESSLLCNLLCLPKKPQHHFMSFWEDFASPLPEKKSVADAVEMLCNSARQHGIENWFLVIPLIHLLSGESQPFESLPPVLNPTFDSWKGFKGSERMHFNRDSNAKSRIGIMKANAHLADIDRLLVHSWMSLLGVDNLLDFISIVPQVELLDILHYIQFTLKNRIIPPDYEALKKLASHLTEKNQHSKSFNDTNGEYCLKTAVWVLDSVCQHIKDPSCYDVLLSFLKLVCGITKAYHHNDSQARGRIHEESIGETLHIMQEWRRNTFRNKLLCKSNSIQFAVPQELEVWKELLSMSFSHEEHTLFWKNTFLKDFEGKLKNESPVDQIGLYTNKMEELSKSSPLLCDTMEKCALEAVVGICQDQSGRAISALFEKHDITKFGKLMSVVVLKSWPKDANGDYADEEDVIFEYLVNWPMAKTVFQIAGAGVRLNNKFSDEAQMKMDFASSAFRSVVAKFISGEIQIKTLNHILQKEQEFVAFLKMDGLCDDARCKDERKMSHLLIRRKEEAKAIHNEKELVKGLLEVCQELPQHVKVDFKGLDRKLNQNFEMMNLNDFMKVYTFEEQESQTKVQVTFFNLCDVTRQMGSQLHDIKDSSIFKMCWTNKVEELSRDQQDKDDTEQLNSTANEEIYTLDMVYNKIFQSCYTKYKGLYDGLKTGKLLLEEVDSSFEVFKEKNKDLRKDLEIMCRVNPSDNTKWVTKRIYQIQQYHELHLAMESAQIVMDIRNIICPDGDFRELEKLLEMNQANFKKISLDCIDDDFINSKNILKEITDDCKQCLQELSLRKNFVLWVKEAINDISELKVFVDLASISAGENDMDVDRVSCFHDAVLGYSSVLYGVKKDSDFKAFTGSLSELWKALKNDKNIPSKLADTARHLEWLKTVKESHGSVEFSSLSLATSINERGIYIIEAKNQKKFAVETSLMLQIQNGHDDNMTCTFDDLKELQNKLMLMSRRKEQNQIEVERFAEVFDSVQRLAKAFVDLYAAGNPLFRCWEAKVYCKTQCDICISMEINFCSSPYCIHLRGNLVEQLTALSKKMELFLDDWRNFMDKQRSDHYYLNYFTAEQIFYLCSVVAPTNVNAEIQDKALMMLSFIKPNFTTSDFRSTWSKFQCQFKPCNSIEEGVHFQSLFPQDTSDMADHSAGLKKLEELWNGYICNESMLFHDLLHIRSLGGLLEMMTIKDHQNEWEEPELSETEDNSVKRTLPKGLLSNEPNLIICPQDEVLTSCICLYMTSDYEPLPSYDEVLLCTPTTSYEQVELFLRRCLTPGGIGQKIYTMLWADQLTYDVSCAMEKCYQNLQSLFKHSYRLVIFCSSDREHTYIPTAFSQFKRDFVPQGPLERIQSYLSSHYTLSSDHKSSAFKGGFSVGIVSSQRAGVGKSLFIQRLYEKLEGTVEQGAAFKKCIQLTDREIDDSKVLQSLYDTPKQKDFGVFHFDVTSSVQKGLNEFIFRLFFLRYVMDSEGEMWRCSHKHLYIIELLESTSYQPRSAPRCGQKENFAFSDIFPKVSCRSPKEVMALELKREGNIDMESDDPLMDDECFRSEAYQRPYQYLTRFHNNCNLDNFTYQDIEGTHANCLQILFIFCGMIDPSWAELRNFVWFLNQQLQDCENSVFCQSEFVGDTLHGFKNFVVEFMILMSKDFASPSLNITDQSPGTKQIDISGLNEKDLAPFLIRKRWESEPHPYIFFNDDHMSMTFIGFHLKLNNQKGVDAINPLTKEVIKKNIMTQTLYTGLKHQGVPFNQDFDQLSRAEKIGHLCSVLGIKGPMDPDETYELTIDNILKMMAIHMRFKCGIPVIIMGETGCGKTRLIKFMCELRRCGAQKENMKLVKVHGGTTADMIYEKVKEAETLARINKENHQIDSFLFFDEANTTEAISSIKEIMCDNSVQGQKLCCETGLQIIAACNPYRKHTDKMIDRLEASGLGYRVRADETEDRLGSIPLRQLVYRVHVLPPSMIPLVWDFGQLSDSTEQMYIKQIVQRQVESNSIENCHISTMTQMLSSSQMFMRERKDECSFVSLRDVERCMQVFVWFYKNHPMFAKELGAFLQKQKNKLTNEPQFLPACERVIWSLLMATGVCYQFCLEDKRPYVRTISQLLSSEYTVERTMQEIELMQDLLLDGVSMGKTIARNEALKENFFMMVICVELRIPLFIVGKPGSSKSLSKTLVADAMQGPASHSILFKELKQIHLVSFQCSPHSTPEGIINTFKQCARFQESKNLDEYIGVVVLDEIGLAEDSPKMPLKTLHPLLEEGCVDDEIQPHKRVGFIGISNWALDPAKMNRGIFVSRGDPTEKELIKSAEGICSSDKTVLDKIKPLFFPFARAYMTVCTEGKGFFGLRDFYSLIKMIFSVTKMSNKRPSADEITEAVLRNFSGKDDVNVMGIFSAELKDDFANTSITPIEMVQQSLLPANQVEESRYLLILTKNYAALQILQQIFFHQIHAEIIFGSGFPKDQEYTQICRNINRVKVCMETGQTVVLLNLQNLYESLYDALNQYYVTLGGQKYVDLGLGTHRVKCRVHENFKLIVIEEKEVVYEQFPIPLINRLEKHYIDINTVLKNEQRDVVRQLQEWVNQFVSLSSQHSTTKQYVPSDIFIGYHSDTCSSVVLQVTQNQTTERDVQTTLKGAKVILLNCATPDSIVRLDKSRLSDEEREDLTTEYVKEQMHSSLGDYIAYHTQQLEQSHFFTEVTTFSRILTAADAEQLKNVTKFDAIKLLSLQQFDTEYSFLKKIREFLGSTSRDKLLIIQTDYNENCKRRNILSSAKYSCISEINKLTASDNTKTFLYFVTKLARIEGGNSYVGFQGGSWGSVHIDDLRRSKEFVSDVYSLKNLRMSDLFKDPTDATETEEYNNVPKNVDSTVWGDFIDTTDLLRSCVQSAVNLLRDVADSGELSTKRVENLLTLLDVNQIQDIHTLWRKIQAVVSPLLANLVSVIDRDCNLDLLLEGEDDIRKLWLEIFGSKEMLSIPYVRVKSNVLMVQSHITSGNIMRCQMPFSWWIKDFLDGLMMQTSRHKNFSPGHFYELYLNTPLGAYMGNVNERMKKHFFQWYLRDFVSMTMKMESDEGSQLLFQALTSCIAEIQRRKRNEEELSLPHIHVAYHLYQTRLQNLSLMISLQPRIVPPLLKKQHISQCPEMVLDVHAAKACIEFLELPNLNTDALCQHWLNQVKKLQASLELICSQQNTRQYGERCKERLHDVSNGWRRIYILSLFVEQMLLGFKNEENQLRALVLSHTQTLSRVLDGNSNVKSNKAFQDVIGVLKSCKQSASDQIFRFGPQCAVCLREYRDPVVLPCHHIYCLTCMRQNLDAGQTSCPSCRQQVPDDFQPQVSEDVRTSIKKNSDFRRRCNGFFIDLLTGVCFKDNTPPTSDVINHLLSYLMVETEHKQIYTKDLSPFDESPDKNPVVRSVILKLLLKFSFDEVNSYLQQHLSSHEESRFVDEEDKTEFYALYINCLEDSMWENMPQDHSNAEELRPFCSSETQFLQDFLADITSVPAVMSIQHLQHIARLRLCLTMAAQLISSNLSDNNIPDVAEDFLKMVIRLCDESGNDWYRVYLIRMLSQSQGVRRVQMLVKGSEISWLFPTEIHQQNKDEGQMDQYLVYGEDYKAVRDAVAEAVVDGDVNQIEEVCEKCTAPPRNRTIFILLALFREVTTLYRLPKAEHHPTRKQCEAFEVFVQGSRYLSQKEVRDFASALVNNQLGSLTILPGRNIKDDIVIELTIHLAAVLLTGNHGLLMPLKQLGLSPQNMLGAFIPTMPEDMLANAHAAIKQHITWYVCPNDHPCFVDNCGQPMEKGKCLECGLEVGGLQHVALPGFKKLQLQDDRTRPGHILGDPERRNSQDALDTKNMSLTPFTLVRLVTHLAMLLGASKNYQFVHQIIQPPVEDVCLFLIQHLIKDLDQLSEALGRGADDTVTTAHLVLRSLQEPVQASHSDIDHSFSTKTSRNTWETTVGAEIIVPRLKDLDQLLQEANGNIKSDSHVSSNIILRVTSSNCAFLASLPQDSSVNSSVVWSCRERLSLLNLTHILEHNDQKEELRLLWRFLQKEREFRQIKYLPDILTLQKRLVIQFQNASDQILGSITEFVEKQTEMRAWYKKHIDIFLKTWNLLRVSVTSCEMKIPDEFCCRDLNLSSDLQYLLPRRQGPGLCASGLVSYLVTLHNELVNVVDSHTGEDSSGFKVSVADLTVQHVICYEVEKDLLPLVLANCQYSLERGHETMSQYDLPKIQQQILTRFLQGKPVIYRTGIPTLVNTQERDYKIIFKAVKEKVHQEPLSSLIRNATSRELESYSEVCEALRIMELVLGFLSVTGGNPSMPLVTYLKDILKMANHIDHHILRALGRSTLKHCVSLWQLLTALKSENMLHIRREPFSEHPVEYQMPLTEENKAELKGFVSRGNVDQWLLEMHEFLLLSLGHPRATDNYNPSWSVKEAVAAYMDHKEVEVPPYVEKNFPENLLLSHIVETWKYAATAKHDLMMDR
ncbi:E3 ubiquitin-protein ligase rnf213-alpha-like [Channa argus]|uniref:E3 ubiquitin-protein ligase rnf213-alpha-like n=1 Tax=Channa argus TaxID=215402 RepID=UPI0035202514